MASERVLRNIERILDEVDQAVSLDDWATVRQCAERVLALDPDNSDGLAFLAAAERGVKFRIHTDSTTSIDKGGGKLVMPPILQTVRELKEAYPDQIDVYLQADAHTLHSKVDRTGDMVDFGSDNYHPRGLLYEHELNLFIDDPTVAALIKEDFEKDLQSTTRVQQASDIEVPSNAVSRIVDEFIRNQL